MNIQTEGLNSTPLRRDGEFNWVYLIEYIGDGILALFFLFYFNRFIAFIVAYILRLFTWHAFRVHIDIDALQISPLAGRIFFKGIRYHGENETIYIHSGYLTWRYWLRRVKDAEIFQPTGRPDNAASNPDKASVTSKWSASVEERGRNSRVRRKKSLPCRIDVQVTGVEAFLHNRSPAYDYVVESINKRDESNETVQMQKEFAHRSEKVGYRDIHRRQRSGQSSTTATASDAQSRAEARPGLKRSDTSASEDANGCPSGISQAPLVLFLLRMLPISVHVSRGAAVLGNENTRSIITAKFDSSDGEFDAGSAGPLDIFKILMNFKVKRIQVQMRPNVDYRRTQEEEAIAIKGIRRQSDASTEKSAVQHSSSSKLKRLFSWLVPKPLRWERLKGISLHARKSLESIRRPGFISNDNLFRQRPEPPSHNRWVGLARYLEDDQIDEHNEWENVEYAKWSKLADIKSLTLKFYWDIPGVVPLGKPPLPTLKDDINGTTPPEYGMDLYVYGGQVVYGPWADRHRINLQHMFFPAPYASARPADTLKPGDTRVCTVFKLFLSIEEETTLRIPFREPSKDWKWKNRAADVGGGMQKSSKQNDARWARKPFNKSTMRDKGVPAADVRPFAWFDLKVPASSTISFSQDMLPGPSGFGAKLDADVSALDIFSSLNHGLLWRSNRITLDCDLSHPLTWNGLREWTFNIGIRRLDFFLLRDHTFLLIDLIEDWSTGPLQDFFLFTPYRYLLNVEFHDFKLFLNTNDANVVNNPEDLDDNNFVILYGRELKADLIIPLDRFRPSVNDITFNVDAYDLGFELSLPSKNTLSVLLFKKDVANLARVKLKGVYTLCNEVRPGLTETLNIDILGEHFSIEFFGFVGRLLARIKENYFGEDIHFKTLEEYQGILNGDGSEAASHELSLKQNELDVILDIKVEDASIILPAGLYNAEEHVLLKVPAADVDLRVNNYYLELMVNSSPVELSYTEKLFHNGNFMLEASGPQLSIDGLQVFGHRLFGLGPTEPPYVSNFDIDAGVIKGECSSAFFGKAVQVAQAAILTFPDPENTMPIPTAVTWEDSTFVRFQCPEIQIGCPVEDEAVMLKVRGVKGTFNDFAGPNFSQRLNMNVPELIITCCDGKSSSKTHKAGLTTTETYAYIKTALTFNMLNQDAQFSRQKDLQQNHIIKHDSKTARAEFLNMKKQSIDEIAPELVSKAAGPVSIPIPSLPPPLTRASRRRSRRFTSSLMSAKPNSVVPMQQTLGDVRPSSVVDSASGRKQSFSMFSSPYKATNSYFDHLMPDLSNVPKIEQEESNPFEWSNSDKEADEDDDDDDDETIYENTDEDIARTNIIINVEPGITALCTPRAIHCVANIVRDALPKLPESLLDNFHFQTMSAVLATIAKKERDKAQAVNVGIHVPVTKVRFINKIESKTEDTQGLADEYNVILSKVAVALRIQHLPGQENEEDSKLVHLKAGSLVVTAQESSTLNEDREVAFRAGVDDILVWLSESTQTAVHISFNILEGTMSSRQVKYLASLIHRTTMLIGELQKRFVNIVNTQSRRIRSLTYYLTVLSEGIGDPIFLTMPSYVLRSSQIRNSDSWKLLSKLRYVLNNLSNEQLLQAGSVCSSESLTFPKDAEARVLRALDRWRSWDTNDVRECIAVRILFGSYAGIKKVNDHTEIPLGVGIRAAGIRSIVDPGTKQSSFSLDGISFGLEVTPPPPPSAVKIFQDFADLKSTVIQLNTSETSIKLNWQVVELVDSVLTLFKEEVPKVSIFDDTPPETTQVSEYERFHIVFSSDVSRMELETLNMECSLSSEQLKISAGGHGWVPDAQSVTINALLASKLSSLVLTTKSKPLLKSTVKSPTMWCAYEKVCDKMQSKEVVKAAADSKELTFHIKEEAMGLLVVVNSVLKEEALQIQQLAKKHPTGVKKQPSAHSLVKSQDPKTKPDSTLILDIAVFLDIYDVRIAILPDLSYVTKGQVARLAVSPAVDEQSSLKIDFDLKGQTHQMQVHSAHSDTLGPPLRMPPLNGSLQLVQTPKVIRLTAAVTMEQIDFEGTAVYGFVSALTNPQFVQGLESIKEDAITVSETVKTTFPSGNKRPTSQPANTKAVIYDINFVLVGFTISAEAPPRVPGSAPSSLLFKLMSTQIRAANRSSDPNKALPFPELRVDLTQMGVELRRSDKYGLKRCGTAAFGALFTCMLKHDEHAVTREFKLAASGPHIALYAETAPLIVEAIVHLQERVKGLDLSKERKYLRKLRNLEQRTTTTREKTIDNSDRSESVEFHSTKMISTFAVDIIGVELAYIMSDSVGRLSATDTTDLVLSINSIALVARSEGEARLIIDEILIQMRSASQPAGTRSANHALLPEVIFEVAYARKDRERKLSFRARGKALELYLEPRFLLPLNDLERSISLSSENFHRTTAELKSTPTASGLPRADLLGDRRISLLLVDARFEGAVVSLQAQKKEDIRRPTIAALRVDNDSTQGKYGQFTMEGGTSAATLRAPGIAFKAQYLDEDGISDSTLNFEINVSSSKNELSPAVVPLFLQVSDSVKQIVRKPSSSKPDDKVDDKKPQNKLIDEEAIIQADPRNVLGRLKLNIGFRIQEQSFALTCQPIARVGAQAKLQDIYLTFNTVDSQENGHFFAATSTFTGLSVRVQHDYSSSSTFNFDMESIYLSVMNSKHLSGTAGISAILRVNPTKAQINARQLQHVLLFREIWLPQEIRGVAAATVPGERTTTTDKQDYFVQKYQQVAASAAFPWNASIGIADLAIDLDLGQAIGKTSLHITDFWASSRKRTSSKQTLCIGIGGIGISSSGRMKGFVDLEQVKVRTSIAFPAAVDKTEETPLIQASIGFDSLKAQASFDYQNFAVADITLFEFIMYNVRDHVTMNNDRLVAILDSDTCNVYCISTTAALALSLTQAFERLSQELQLSFDQSLRDIDRYLRRRTSTVTNKPRYKPTSKLAKALVESSSRTPISLHTDVVVTMRSIDVGCFPGTLDDQQVLRLEASDIQARFAVFLDEGKIHSGLGLTLGQLRASLAAVPRPNLPAKSADDISIQDVVRNVRASRGGVILRVPRVVASMQTWQGPESFIIDYIFKSTFEGKIDVGWNFTRIGVIRTMWERHSRTLAARVGKPLPESAVKITGGPKESTSGKKDSKDTESKGPEQEKLTAVVNLPQSKYTYRALEPPVIETPQLRDMGEATPPLEWVGLHRDRLPNVTHQIVIVSLLEIAKEVEDAYSRILGSASS